MRLGMKTAPADVADESSYLGARMFPQVFHLRRALEISRVQHA